MEEGELLHKGESNNIKNGEGMANKLDKKMHKN